MKRMFWVFLLILGFTLSWNLAYADGEFYVIAAGKRAKRTVLVSPKNTAAESGTALLNALSKISDATAANPYLIIIEPGIYDIGSSSLQMKSYVDIQGSGENVTKITGTIDCDDSEGSGSGVVNGANNAEIRFLTIENTGDCDYAIGFYTNQANALMTHITSKASGATNNYGVRIYDSSSPVMTNVTATASGGTHARGVFNESSFPTMTNVTAKASDGTNNYGVYNFNGSSAVMTNVTATGSGGTHARGVFNETSSAPVMNNVTATATDGTNNYGVLNKNCTTAIMTNVTVTASGGTLAYGVYNDECNSEMNNVTATASGATNQHYGVFNYDSSPVMNHVTATASGGDVSYGVINSTSASPVMTYLTAEASGATTNIGVHNLDTSTVKIDFSVISGENYSVSMDGGTVYIANTRIEGSVNRNSGTLTCFNVCKEYAGYTCP